MSYKVITHDALCVAAARWLHRHHDNCNIPNCTICAVDISFWTIFKERPDVVGFSSSVPPVLIEVKTSLSDFKADADKFVRKYPDRGIGAFKARHNGRLYGHYAGNNKSFPDFVQKRRK